VDTLERKNQFSDLLNFKDQSKRKRGSSVIDEEILNGIEGTAVSECGSHVIEKVIHLINRVAILIKSVRARKESKSLMTGGAAMHLSSDGLVTQLLIRRHDSISQASNFTTMESSVNKNSSAPLPQINEEAESSLTEDEEHGSDSSNSSAEVLVSFSSRPSLSTQTMFPRFLHREANLALHL
jgi:hypothetical protein